MSCICKSSQLSIEIEGITSKDWERPVFYDLEASTQDMQDWQPDRYKTKQHAVRRVLI
jgi:hypothetical protein